MDTNFGIVGETVEGRLSAGTNETGIPLTTTDDLLATGGMSNAGAAVAFSPWAASNALTQRLYAEQDANYNVTSLTDASGNVVQRYVYSPYGVATVETAAGATTMDVYLWQYTFQGGRQDLATGLIHFGTREYDQVLGRWMQEDRARYINGINTYQFVIDNPVHGVDPSGFWSIYRWLYTGDGNANDETYNAATDAAGNFLYHNSPVRGGYVAGTYAPSKLSCKYGGAEVGGGGVWTIDDGGYVYGEAGGYIGGGARYGGGGAGRYWGSNGSGPFGGFGVGVDGVSGGQFGGGQWYIGVGKGPVSVGFVIDPSYFGNWYNSVCQR